MIKVKASLNEKAEVILTDASLDKMTAEEKMMSNRWKFPLGYKLIIYDAGNGWCLRVGQYDKIMLCRESHEEFMKLVTNNFQTIGFTESLPGDIWGIKPDEVQMHDKLMKELTDKKMEYGLINLTSILWTDLKHHGHMNGVKDYHFSGRLPSEWETVNARFHMLWQSWIWRAKSLMMINDTADVSLSLLLKGLPRVVTRDKPFAMEMQAIRPPSEQPAGHRKGSYGARS